MLKACAKCNQVKSGGEFQKMAASKDGLQFWCRACIAAANKTRRDALRPKREPIPPVPEGHKRCTKCKTARVVSEFVKNSRSPDGLHTWCRSCSSRYYRENRARLRAAGDKWYRENREARSETVKRWRDANPEKVRAVSRRWQRENRDRCRVFESARYVKRRNAPTIPFTPDQLNEKWDYYGRKCWICRQAPATASDHVKPLAKGGWHALANLRPICRPCNSRKRDKWPYVRPDQPQLEEAV